MLITFSQRDPKWANVKIGDTDFTIGRYGCVITSIAMLSSYFLPTVTPDVLARRFKFDKEGRILWNSVDLENFWFDFRVRQRCDDQVKAALSDPGRAVILEVSNGLHWVVGLSRSFLGGTFRIADPWLGDRATLQRYDNTYCGAAFFVRK